MLHLRQYQWTEVWKLRILVHTENNLFFKKFKNNASSVWPRVIFHAKKSGFSIRKILSWISRTLPYSPGDTTHNNDVQRVRQLNMVSPQSRIPLPKMVDISYFGGMIARSIFSADEDFSRIICVLNLTHQLKDTPPFLVCTNMVCSDPRQMGFLVRYAHIKTQHWKQALASMLGRLCTIWLENLVPDEATR